MTTTVEKSVVVHAPISTVYNQWTQFEEFPRFMGGVERVTQLEDDRMEWVAEIAGVRRQWVAKVVEQVPDRTVAWAAEEGATNAGTVSFEDAGAGQTIVRLTLEFEPEGFLEKVGDALKIVEGQAKRDLDKFKEYIEHTGHESGAWRGTISGGGTSSTDTGTDVGTPPATTTGVSTGIVDTGANPDVEPNTGVSAEYPEAGGQRPLS